MRGPVGSDVVLGCLHSLFLLGSGFLLFHKLPCTVAVQHGMHTTLSQHRKEKYFLHEIEGCGINFGQGYSHQLHSLACALVEAEALRRTLVMPQTTCLLQFHTLGDGIQYKNWTDIIDTQALEPRFRVLLVNNNTQFVESMQLDNHTVAFVPPDQPHRSLRRMENIDVVIRMHRHWPHEPRWWYPCFDDPTSALRMPFNSMKGVLHPVNTTLALVQQIQAILGDQYCSLHVRRGDKLKLLPGLDKATRPDAILNKISTACPPGHKLFIASNEAQEGFFSPLTDHYEVFTYRNFTDVLQSAGVVSKDPKSDSKQRVLDNLVLYQIEAGLLEGAPKVWMDTFCYLYTDGCQEGVNGLTYGVPGYHGLVG